MTCTGGFPTQGEAFTDALRTSRLLRERRHVYRKPCGCWMHLPDWMWRAIAVWSR